MFAAISGIIDMPHLRGYSVRSTISPCNGNVAAVTPDLAPVAFFYPVLNAVMANY